MHKKSVNIKCIHIFYFKATLNVPMILENLSSAAGTKKNGADLTPTSRGDRLSATLS